MEALAWSQTQIFGCAVLLGIALGAFYDAFRLLRLFTGAERKQLFIEDTLYLSLCGIATFLFTFAANGGTVRFYILAGEAAGWCLYRLTLGLLTARLMHWVVLAVRKARKFCRKHITVPLLAFIKKFARRITAPLKKWINQTRNAKNQKKSSKKPKSILKQRKHVVYNPNIYTDTHRKEQRLRHSGRVDVQKRRRYGERSQTAQKKKA